MRKFLVAVSFFTRLSINVKDVKEDEFYESMIMMPVVGLIIGTLLAVVAWALSYINLPMVAAIVVILTYLWISGGLHLDGVADTVDGLMSARDRERVMEIMKDSRLGSFGAIALILYFLTFFTGLVIVIPLNPWVLVLMPVVGRFCGIQNCCFSTYAQGGGGLGRRITEITKPWHFVLYLILIAVPAYFVFGLPVVIGLGASMVFAFYLRHVFYKGIGGMTGDTIGMTIELSQMAFLLTMAVVMTNWSAISGILL